jgi:uncharacterized RDD family membrane protein YckC
MCKFCQSPNISLEYYFYSAAINIIYQKRREQEMATYAGVGSRIGAIILDHIILLIIALIIALPLGFSGAMFGMMAPGAEALFTGMYITMMALNFIIWLVYFTYFEGTSGQTLGKRALGIKVTREGGGKMNMGAALVRTILRIIDILPTAYILGFILVLATKKKQRVGDMAASTVVVKA